MAKRKKVKQHFLDDLEFENVLPINKKRHKNNAYEQHTPYQLSLRKKIQFFNSNQRHFFSDLIDPQTIISIGLGSAGTGKTYLAVAAALKALIDKRVSKIIITRPVIGNDEEIGYLPGDINEKLDPYVKPITEAVVELVGGKSAHELFNTGVIEICPLAYMRGRTFKDCYVIADEMSSATISQTRNLLTRIGWGSELAILGDPAQSDLPNHIESGLDDFVRKFAKISDRYSRIGMTQFRDSDVVRHEVVSDILEIYAS